MKNLYYYNGTETVKIRIKDIDFVYVICANQMRNSDIVYDVVAHTSDDDKHTLFTGKEIDAKHYLSGFKDIGFWETWGGDKYYNNETVSIDDAVEYGRYPFFTDR